MVQKLKSCFFLTLFAALIFFICQLWLVNIYNDAEIRSEDIKVPVILWWTPFIGNISRLESCGKVNCYFTQNRDLISHSFLGGILFYGSSITIGDLPLPRREDVDWGLLHEESPRNVPMLTSEYALSLFNHSATFSRHSDVPLTLVDLDGEEELLGTKYFVQLEEKNRLMKENKLAPLLYIQSDCNTANERDSYVQKLMEYIPIDSYGLCLNNKPFPERLNIDGMESFRDSAFYSFVARYKFTLAFENAVCDDYITEKLWRPLIVGSVPVYYGSPSFKDWLPNNKSAISVRDFASPKKLADFLSSLASDDSRYREYIAHKLSPNYHERIANPRLLNIFKNWTKDVPNEFGKYLSTFECLVCQRIHDKFKKPNTHIITKEHYNCPLPVSLLTNEINVNNWWVSAWKTGHCQAKLLAKLALKNTSINSQAFDDQIMRLTQEKKC